VAQHHVFDRLVGHLADAADDVLRHHRRGLGVDDHHRVVADHDAGIRVALGGVGIGVIRQPGEADLLLFEVGLAGKGFGGGVHVGGSSCRMVASNAFDMAEFKDLILIRTFVNVECIRLSRNT
jgi:hypothetical protein